MKRGISLIFLIIILLTLAVFITWARNNHQFFWNYASEGVPTLTLSSDSQTLIPGEEIVVNLMIDTDGVEVSRVEVQGLRFDPRIFESVSLTPGEINNFETIVENHISQSTGEMSYTTATKNNYYNGRGTLAKITLIPKINADATNLNFSSVKIFDATGRNVTANATGIALGANPAPNKPGSLSLIKSINLQAVNFMNSWTLFSWYVFLPLAVTFTIYIILRKKTNG